MTASPFRNDTGVQEGGEISIHYDPMIAKRRDPAPSRAAGDRGSFDARSILLCRRHPATTFRSSFGADEPSALA